MTSPRLLLLVLALSLAGCSRIRAGFDRVKRVCATLLTSPGAKETPARPADVDARPAPPALRPAEVDARPSPPASRAVEVDRAPAADQPNFIEAYFSYDRSRVSPPPAADRRPFKLRGRDPAEVAIDELPLGAYAVTILKREGITTLAQLLGRSPFDLGAMYGVGPTFSIQIQRVVSKLGLALSKVDYVPPPVPVADPFDVLSQRIVDFDLPPALVTYLRRRGMKYVYQALTDPESGVTPVLTGKSRQILADALARRAISLDFAPTIEMYERLEAYRRTPMPLSDAAKRCLAVEIATLRLPADVMAVLLRNNVKRVMDLVNRRPSRVRDWRGWDTSFVPALDAALAKHDLAVGLTLDRVVDLTVRIEPTVETPANIESVVATVPAAEPAVESAAKAAPEPRRATRLKSARPAKIERASSPNDRALYAVLSSPLETLNLPKPLVFRLRELERIDYVYELFARVKSGNLGGLKPRDRAVVDAALGERGLTPALVPSARVVRRLVALDARLNALSPGARLWLDGSIKELRPPRDVARTLEAVGIGKIAELAFSSERALAALAPKHANFVEAIRQMLAKVGLRPGLKRPWQLPAEATP